MDCRSPSFQIRPTSKFPVMKNAWVGHYHYSNHSCLLYPFCFKCISKAHTGISKSTIISVRLWSPLAICISLNMRAEGIETRHLSLHSGILRRKKKATLNSPTSRAYQSSVHSDLRLQQGYHFKKGGQTIPCRLRGLIIIMSPIAAVCNSNLTFSWLADAMTAFGRLTCGQTQYGYVKQKAVSEMFGRLMFCEIDLNLELSR